MEPEKEPEDQLDPENAPENKFDPEKVHATIKQAPEERKNDSGEVSKLNDQECPDCTNKHEDLDKRNNYFCSLLMEDLQYA